MNDAGNQYLGAGVEIRAVVAAPASPSCPGGMGGGPGRSETEAGMWKTPPPQMPLSPCPCHSPATPHFHLMAALMEGELGDDPPGEDRGPRRWSLGLSLLEEPCLTSHLWTPEPHTVLGPRCVCNCLGALPCAAAAAVPDVASRGRAWPPHCFLPFLGSRGPHPI